MFSTTNLAKRGTVYYFRIAVPKALVPRFGRSELTASLRTSDPLQAKVRRRAISSAVETLFERLPRMASISIPEINEKVRGYFQTCLNQGEEYVQEFPDDPMINVSDEADYSLKKAKQMQADLAKANFPPKVRELAQGMMPSPANGDKGFDPDALLYACRTVMRAEIEAFRILGAKLSGDYASVAPKDVLFEGMAATGLTPLPGEKPAVSPSTMSF